MDSTLVAMKKTYVLLSPHLDERMRRCGVQRKRKPSGTAASQRYKKVTGVSRPCITRGCTIWRPPHSRLALSASPEEDVSGVTAHDSCTLGCARCVDRTHTARRPDARLAMDVQEHA